MTKTTLIWHKGPPPHVGWWNAKDLTHMGGEWRWWNGKNWSSAGREHHTAEEVNLLASTPSAFANHEILWSDYWPENARVPRLDPTDGHWTFNTTGELPCAPRRRVDIAYLDGSVELNTPAGCLYWGAGKESASVAAWRPAIDTAVNQMRTLYINP